MTDLRHQRSERAQVAWEVRRGPDFTGALPPPRPLFSWKMLSAEALPSPPILSASEPQPGVGEDDQTLGLGFWPGVSCGLKVLIKTTYFPVCLLVLW